MSHSSKTSPRGTDQSPAQDRHRLIWLVSGVLAVALFGVAVFVLSFRAELDQAAERGRADLALSADRLTTGLQRYRELAVLLSDHPTVLAQVFSPGEVVPEGGAPGDGTPDDGTPEEEARENSADVARATSDLLQRMADRMGAHSVMLVAKDAQVLAAAGAQKLPKGAQAGFNRATQGALGVSHFVDQEGHRQYAFAAPVFRPGGAAQAVVMVNVDIDLLEWGWPTEASAIYFTDDYGVAFISNRSELVLRGGLAGDMPVISRHRLFGHELWRHEAGPYIPSPALHLTQPLPVVGMKAEMLMNLRPVIAIAGLQAGMAAALALVFAAFLAFAMERRRTLAVANARLEARVAARTEALEAANRELQHEVQEREEAESRLKRAQADLVQAGKLSALGEMSAGISHELNQPLMAIRSFAENAQAFIARENPERAAENLGRISELARRMGRIIKNLRAFAKQEPETIVDVDLTAVIEAALEMTQGKIARHGVTLDWTPVEAVWVRGGEVRLQQVVMNLLSNAVDAMADQPGEKRIVIEIEAGELKAGYDSAAAGRPAPSHAPMPPVRLRISDTGPGITEPEKIFDPFYTTKAQGAAEGMGLGLSISYGLIQSFGGRIRGENRADGGARFTIELQRARLSPVQAAQ